MLLVCGLLLLGGALLRLADLLGASGDLSAGKLVWTALVVAGVAAYASLRCNSAICTMIAGLAGGIAVLAAANWIFGAESQTAYRWLLLALAIVFALAALVLRGARPRHAELMIVTGGLATLSIFLLAALRGVIGLFGPGFGDGILPGFWELVLLVAGCGLLAYGAVDRVPGAAWLGVANLAGVRRRGDRGGRRDAPVVAAPAPRARRRRGRRGPAAARAAAARAGGVLGRAAARVAHGRRGRGDRPGAQRRAAVPLGCR